MKFTRDTLCGLAVALALVAGNHCRAFEHQQQQLRGSENNDGTASMLAHSGEARRLSGFDKMEFPECVTLGMTVAQCEAFILQQMPNVPNGENVQVQTRQPRTDPQMDATYWKIGIPTNFVGTTVGFLLDGKVTWPGEWKGTGPDGFRAVGPFNCIHQSAQRCCDLIKSEVPDIDVNGNYLECYYINEHAMPYTKADGSLGYCTYEWGSDTSYKAVDVTPAEIESVYTGMQGHAGALARQVRNILAAQSASYEIVQRIANGCRLISRDVPGIEGVCNGIDVILHPPNVPGQNIVVDMYLQNVFEELITRWNNFEVTPWTMEHTIIIHGGDQAGSFVHFVPIIGGGVVGKACVPE
jgi:hypothetical protein